MTARCPVCAMRALSNSNELEFRGMYFLFCSPSCQERFLQDPDFFLSPRHARGHGPEAVKRRRLRLGHQPSRDQAETLRDLLEGLMGVRTVGFRGDRLEITYDARQASVEGLERELTEAGERLGPGWGERLRRAFVHYEEEME
ncbi:hypothetical protein [Thiohalorhabdus methylotrophus]|uniref:YHS domain-containing protein n=1 Tax=Thiohalorhabdus methylotrophus TaxID=3242694 RepID=A0ABV4TSM1_9GAMM